MNCLLRWDREDLDVNAYLPVLATYLGHVGVSSTQYYLQTIPELWSRGQRRFQTYFHQNILQQGGGQ